MARRLHWSDLEKPAMPQAMYASNWCVTFPFASRLRLIWHLKGFIYKEETRKTYPKLLPQLRLVRMEVIVVGTERLGRHVVMIEKVSLYSTGTSCLPSHLLQQLVRQPHFLSQNLWSTASSWLNFLSLYFSSLPRATSICPSSPDKSPSVRDSNRKNRWHCSKNLSISVMAKQKLFKDNNRNDC